VGGRHLGDAMSPTHCIADRACTHTNQIDHLIRNVILLSIPVPKYMYIQVWVPLSNDAITGIYFMRLPGYRRNSKDANIDQVVLSVHLSVCPFVIGWQGRLIMGLPYKTME